MKIFIFLLLLGLNIFAQSFNITGRVKNALTEETLTSANVYLVDYSQGTITGAFGNFLLGGINAGEYLIKISYVGFETKFINVKLDKNVYLEINLRPVNIQLNNLVIEGTNPIFRETPVAFSELTENDIETKLGSREAVNILAGTPSAYISQQGGGIGEQRLSIRGFDQTNIAVMINGIPINNPENGEIYWSNWAGMSELIQYVNVQRGLSAIPYSTSSIGGNVNFITMKPSGSIPYIKLRSEVGSFSQFKNSLSFSSVISDGLTLSGLISKRKLDGFADRVYSDELTYYLALGMLFKKHSIQIQLIGSPQEHGQRLTPQSIKEWNDRGKRYNSDWGYLNGNPLNLRDNEFHNPTLNINYNWQIKPDLIWNNILSLSMGSGGGTVPPWYPELSKTENGLINFDKEWEFNLNNNDPIYHDQKKRSIIALRKGIHKNSWGTFITALKYDWNKFQLSFGLDGKFYEAQNYNELSNMLGGDYYIGSGNVNDNSDRLLFVGEKVDFNADSFTRNYGGFIQLEYKKKNLTGYVNFALSKTEFKRIDYFNFQNNDPLRETGWNDFSSSTVKAGINYNLDSVNNLYINVGNFSRAPLSMNVYDFSNNLYENVKNENILSFEFGYGLQTNIASVNINYFYTKWTDKSLSQTFLNSDSTAIYYYNIFGASANHQGIELDGKIYLFNDIVLNSVLSIADNKWTSNVDAFVRPESNPTDEIKYHAFTKGLKVGNHPMITSSIGLLYTKSLSNNANFYFNPIYTYYGKYYSSYNPELRTDPNQIGIQPWRIPNFYIVDVHSGVEFIFENYFIKSLNLSLNVFNVLNEDYISDAIDGAFHNAESADVWYGLPRWWSTSFSIVF